MPWKSEPIVKNLDGSYVVRHNGLPYQVCSKELDPANVYDLTEVAAAWAALPEGEARKQVETPPPPPTEAELQAARRAKIQAELGEIDLASVRPLRAITEGAATDYDRVRLAELEDRAAQLREELREMEEEA